MSKRNTKAAKARRRADRARREQARCEQAARQARSFAPLVDVQSLNELVVAAGHGERLPCGCDAHELLHDMLGALAA